jgi:transposase
LTTARVAVGEAAMAFRELTMIDVKEVLRRWQAKQGARKIARGACLDRKTAQRYIDEAKACGLPQDRELSDDEVHQVAARVQTRPAPAPSDPWKELVPHKEKVEQWLSGSRPLRLKKVHILLGRLGVTSSYATLRRFAMAECGWHKPEPTVRVNDAPPGVEAQVDFAKMGLVRDAETGKMRVLWVLIVTLCFSRHLFVWPTFRQTTEAMVEGLDAAWKFFGGMTKTIVPDNTKAIVDQADPLAPKLVEAFSDYAQARGLFVDPARVRKPRDKPRVENQVAYVRENWFEGETLPGLDEARTSARQWSSEVAGTRVHGTTRRVPREVYEAEEKGHMLPAPERPFDVPKWGNATVHADHHIDFLKSLYSVPTLYLHKRVRVRADKTIVRIYFGTQLIKTHGRQLPGGRSTDVRDYPADKSAYALRSVDAALVKAKEKGHHIGEYAERVLGGPLPWARMRQAYALLGLCDKYGAGRVEALCQSALAFDVIDVSRLQKMLKSAARPAPKDAAGGEAKVVALPLPAPRFARPEEQFRTRQGSSGEEGPR